MNLNELSPWQPKRDQWGRPLIVPPTGGDPIGYTRVTTVAKTLDTEHALSNWKQRMTAAGLARRPDLLALIASHLTVTGDIPIEQKNAVQQWCEEAQEAARASAGANLGTALHKFTETLDAGTELANVPEALRNDLDAYRQLVTQQQLHMEMIEAFVVLDEYRVAGTLDRLLRLDGVALAIIGDLKTSNNIDYSWLSIAVQLATYAHGTLYHDGVRTPLPPVDLNTALVIHLPSTQGEAYLHSVDIAAGWEAFHRSLWTREWRDRTVNELKASVIIPKTVGNFVPAVATELIPQTPHEQPADNGPLADPARVEWVKGRLKALPADAAQALANVWPANVPGFKQDHRHTESELARIEFNLGYIEAQFSVAFSPAFQPVEMIDAYIAPVIELRPQAAPEPVAEWVNEVSDYPEAVRDATRDALQADFHARGDAVCTRVATWFAEALEAGCPFSLSKCLSQRRVAILNACYSLIEHLEAYDFVLAAIAHVTGERPATVGAGLGRLTRTQADTLRTFALDVSRGEFAPIFDNEGTCERFQPIAEQKAEQT